VRRAPVQLVALAVSVAVSIAGSVAGCGTGASSAPPQGLTASVEQSRDNENRHLLQLVLHNGGGDGLQVLRLQLHSPAYREAPAKAFDQPLAAGQTIAFPVPYGDVVCSARPRGTAVTAVLKDGDGTREVRLQVPDGDAFLPRRHDRDCALERVRAAVDVRFTGLARDGTLVRGALELSRRSGDAQVRLTDTQSSILFLLQPTGPLPLTLDGQTSSVPVAVSPVRCDPHALIESKRSFTFPVFVALGDGEPVQTSVTADAAGQELMMATLRDHCRAEGIDLQ
jgi:hypothetical protein